MTIRQNQDGSASIEAYSLTEFTKEVVDLIGSGYKLNYDLNEGNPQSFGVFMTVTLYPTSDDVMNGVQVGSVSGTEVTALKEVIESVKNEGVTVETVTNSGVFEPAEQPVKVDGRRKKN